MMRITRTQLLFPFAFLATATAVTLAAEAQESPAAAPPVHSAEPVDASATGISPAPIASEAEPNNREAPAVSASTSPAPSPPSDGTAPIPAPTALPVATAPPLAAPTPSEHANPDKRKKGKRRKARKPAARQSNENVDPDWGDPWGDNQDAFQAAGLSFKFLLQTQYRQTFAYHSNNADPAYRMPEETLVRELDGWDLNRLFLRITAEPSKYVRFKFITDFAEFAHGNGYQTVKQAFVDLSPIPKHLHFLAGVLKLPFSITELDPIAKYEFTRLDQSNDLIKGLGFAGRDIGAEVVVSPLAKPRYLTFALGTFRGHAIDEQGYLFGEVGARVTTEPVKGLRFGLDWAIMPKTITYLNPFTSGGSQLLSNPENSNFPRSGTWDKGQAVSVDATYYRLGLMLRTEGMMGTRVDHDTQYGATRFGAAWAIAAYRFPVGSLGIQPALRAAWLDTDMTHPSGLRTQLAAGIATYFTQSVRFLLDLERTIVEDHSPYINQPSPLRAVPYDALSNTCISGQVQVAL